MVASRTTKDERATTLLAKLSEHVDTLFDGLLIGFVDEEFGTLEAYRSRYRQVVCINTRRTSTRFKMDDHSAVGSERAWASETVVDRRTMR